MSMFLNNCLAGYVIVLAREKNKDLVHFGLFEERAKVKNNDEISKLKQRRKH